jgi:hypothetical protein
VGRRNIQHYAWERENNLTPEMTSQPSSPTSADGGVSLLSNESEESTTVSHPFPIDFDASTEEGGDCIAVTIQHGPEMTNSGELDFEGHVARVLVGEWTLAKGRSKVGEREAVMELFARVHRLAEEWRRKDGEARDRSLDRVFEGWDEEESAEAGGE